MKNNFPPTRIIAKPKRENIGGKSVVIYQTDRGPFTITALAAELKRFGIIINDKTLYDRIMKNWSAASNLVARHAAITTRLLPVARPIKPSEDYERLSGRSRGRKLDKIKIGTWEAAQL